MFTKIKNAYLLIYERESVSDKLPVVIAVPEEVKKLVAEEKMRYQVAKSVLNKDYIAFICRVMLETPCAEQKDYKLFAGLDLQLKAVGPSPSATEFECWKFFVLFITSTVLRLKRDAVFPLYPLLEKLQTVLSRNVGLSLWLLENFSHVNLLREFFVHCPVSHPRFFVASMLISACRTVYLAREKDKIAKLVVGDACGYHILKHGGEETQSADSRAVFLTKPFGHKFPYILILVNNLLILWNTIERKREHFAHFSLLLSRISRLGPEIRKYMLSAGVLGAIFDVFMETQTGVSAAMLETRRFIEPRRELAGGYNLGFERVLPTGAKAVTKRSVLKNPPSFAVMQRNNRKQRFLLDLFSQVSLICLIFLFYS